ncbi:MAG: cupin domain-containing protein [Propionibacteriaceae bacterium]|nr:cupin domain-containing protein [Propionibacteriaceae bacterium]
MADLPRESRFDGTYQRVGVVSDNALWSFLWLDGWEWPKGMHHQHAHDQIIYVISGRLDESVGDTMYHLEAGDVLYIPANIPHTGHPIKGETTHLIEGFAPIRTDYLYIAEHQLDQNVPPRDLTGARVEKAGSGSRWPFENPKS